MYMVKSLGKYDHIFAIVQDPRAIDAHLKMLQRIARIHVDHSIGSVVHE
jgi:hypothetical protein